MMVEIKNYFNTYPEELELSKESTGNHEVSFLDLDIKISFKRLSDPTRQVKYYLTFCNQSLITHKSSNNPHLMNRQGVSTEN